MEAAEERLGRAMGWIQHGNLTLRQISDAHIVERAFWVTFTGARYPKHSYDSVFISRPWDDGTKTARQKKALINLARRDML